MWDSLFDDSAPVVSTLSIGELTITDVNVQVDIDHTWVGDLDLVLGAPGGASVVLLDRPGFAGSGYGCDNNNMSVLFDDESTSGVDLENHCADTDPWYVGDALPVAPLSSLDVLQPAGDWTLTVTDNVGGDDGTIIGWSLEICFDSGTGPQESIFEDGFESGDRRCGLRRSNSRPGSPRRGQRSRASLRPSVISGTTRVARAAITDGRRML